jgi:hypothetical protein
MTLKSSDDILMTFVPVTVGRTFISYIFLASSKNLASPKSVSGCLSSPRIDSNGQVHTSAPTLQLLQCDWLCE